MAKVTKIHSENDVFQNLETLRRNRDKRNKLGKFMIEGVRNINNALEYGWAIDAFMYAPHHTLSRWAVHILKTSTARYHYELPYKLLKKLSDKQETSELLAVVKFPPDDLGRIPINKDFLTVIFDRPVRPGNLGTIIRSCDALGAAGLIVTGHAVDVYDPETVSAATGSLFSLPVVRLPSHKELLPWLKTLRLQFPDLQITGTDEKGEHAIGDHDFTVPTIVLVGNETWGLSQAYKELADVLVRIPMRGSASSLNVANAASIVLYEISRQRKYQ